jgi:hypothetical protein
MRAYFPVDRRAGRAAFVGCAFAARMEGASRRQLAQRRRHTGDPPEFAAMR